MAMVILPTKQHALIFALRAQGLMESASSTHSVVFRGPVIVVDTRLWQGKKDGWKEIAFDGEPKVHGHDLIISTPPDRDLLIRIPATIMERAKEWSLRLNISVAQFARASMWTLVCMLDGELDGRKVSGREFIKPLLEDLGGVHRVSRNKPKKKGTSGYKSAGDFLGLNKLIEEGGDSNGLEGTAGNG